MTTSLHCNREQLAKRVIERVNVLAVKLIELQDDIRALWTEFEKLSPGETIAGCTTKKEFCERMLHRTPRAIRYMLAGGNQPPEENISPSPLAGFLEARRQIDQKIGEELARQIRARGLDQIVDELLDEELDHIIERGVFTSSKARKDLGLILVNVGHALIAAKGICTDWGAFESQFNWPAGRADKFMRAAIKAGTA